MELQGASVKDNGMRLPYRCIRFLERRGVCAENLDAATPVSERKTVYAPMIDDTKSGILNDEPDEAHRRLQQGFEALRPAFCAQL